MDHERSQQTGKLLWSVREFCESLGFTREFFYRLPDAQAPHSIRLGGARRIVESPVEYLERISTLQRAA